MKQDRPQAPPFFSAKDEVQNLRFPSYELAFLDLDFLLLEENRPIRLQLEYLKPEIIQRQLNINSTIVIFGSARVDSQERAKEKLHLAEANLEKNPKDEQCKQQLQLAKKNLTKSHYYEEARRLAHIISRSSQANSHRDFVVITGGGPGIMEAANRGAHEADAKSIGLNILLPKEEAPNPYISPELNFKFHYFAMRKMHFLMRARALVFFPGGFGTFDELFETLTLMQTKKIAQVPVILFGKSYWNRAVNFDFLAEHGAIDEEDKNLFQFAESAEEAWQMIADFYQIKTDV